MHPRNQPLRNFFMGYYRQAIAEIERGVVIIAEENCAKVLPHGTSVCQGVPLVGSSIDRRTFGHLREVYNDKVIFTLTCFVCAQRRTHTKHFNSAIKWRNLELFKPDHTERGEEKVLRIHTAQTVLKESLPEDVSASLCKKRYTSLECEVFRTNGRRVIRQ